MSENKTYKFDDTVLATIAKTLQIALLTGTDIVDNLRLIEVTENSEGSLKITDNYESQFEHWLAQMFEELERNHDQSKESTEPDMEQLSLFE